MANRFPLIVNTTSGNSVQELPSGDFLDLSSSGIANSGNITVNAGSFFIGNGSQLTGLAATYGNANVVANLAALGSNPVSTTGNITGGNLLTGGLISSTSTVTGSQFNGSGAGLTSIPGANVTGTLSIPTTSYAATVSGNAQANITSVGTLTSLAVTANVTGGNILTAGIISATGNVTGNVFIGNGSQLTGLPAGYSNSNLATLGSNVISTSGNVTSGNFLTGGLISATGAITGAAITGSSLTVSTGNISGGNIVNNNANGVGNIGSATVYFNTVFGKATTAQYADLAELYAADAEYSPGTVLDFGGTYEVTLSSVDSSAKVAGVVSTNPAHLMNSVLNSKHKVAVALQGRVPTSVVGTVRKGDMMVSAGNGHAQASATPAMGTVIGKALENFDGVSGMIEIVVGRL